jgi:predicted Zn-dependent peptidase
LEVSPVALSKIFIHVFVFLVFFGNICEAEDLASSIKLNIQHFTLENGMLFLIVERHTTPQVACRVAIRAGSALEEAGKTGIAHMVEHMMFKGTKNFGTLDFKRDKELQERIEAAYQVILKERRKRNPNQALIQEKIEEMEKLRLECQKIYVPQAFSAQLGRNGAVGVNAYTSKDETQYVMSVPSDMIEQWFSIVSEELFEPSWRRFYVEKEVVQREWAFRYVNDPAGAAWLDLYATAYSAHPYRNPTIGWKSDMEKFSTKDAIDFHTKYYNPTNAVCVLVGDVTVQKAKELAEIYFERYPAGRRSPEEVTAEPQQQGPRKNIRFLKGARTPLVRIGFHGTHMGTRDFYALDAMIMILSYGRGARMTQNIVNRGLAVEAWAHNPDNRYRGMIILGGSPNEPETHGLSPQEELEAYLKACEELEEMLLAEVGHLKSELVSSRELERIKKLNERQFLDRIRSNEELASSLASLEVQVGWQYLTAYLQEMGKITPEDIMRVAKKYTPTHNKTSVYVIPGGEPDRPPETYTEVRSLTGSAAAKVLKPADLTNHSVYPTPEEWRHPLSFERKPVKIEYPEAQTASVEGATIFYLPDRELPLIDLMIVVKAGEVDVNQSKTGLIQVLNEGLIQGGTRKYSPSQLALVLDENAIRLSVSAREEETIVRLSVLKDDWEKGLALLEQVLFNPRFDLGVLEAVKQQQLTTLRRQGGDAQSVSRREGMIWHFRGHPYGRDPLQGLDTIPTITKEDLKSFLERYFVPANMVIAAAGDIEKEQVVEGLKGLFGALPKSRAPVRKLDDPSETPPVLALIHKPGQVQSQVTLLLHGVKRTHPGYWKMSLLMDMFGGRDSLIYTRLRENLGLVYAAWFGQAYRWKAGFLTGYIGCKGDRTCQAIRETVKIMTELRKDVPEKELEQKRLDALNSFVFNVDKPAELVEVYSLYRLRREPLDTLEIIQDSYINVTEEEMSILARKLLDPKKLQVFIVGDKGIRVERRDGTAVTLEEDLKELARELDLPYAEIQLR